jgi:hypothetical protein
MQYYVFTDVVCNCPSLFNERETYEKHFPTCPPQSQTYIRIGGCIMQRTASTLTIYRKIIFSIHDNLSKDSVGQTSVLRQSTIRSVHASTKQRADKSRWRLDISFILKPKEVFMRIFNSVLLVLALLLIVQQPVVGQVIGKGSMQHNFPLRKAAIINSALPAGTYNVGSGGYFPTIDSAFNSLSSGGILGPITLVLTDTLYVAEPTKNGSFTLVGPIAGAGPTSRITIRPADNVAVTIRGNGEAVILFHNVSYLTLNGIDLQGNTRLTVHALYNTVGSRWNSAIDFIGNSDFNMVQNLTAYSDDITRGSEGVGLYADGLGGPDSCLVSGVSVTSAWAAIYISGLGVNPQYRPIGNIVRGNHFGSPVDSLINRGIQIEMADKTIVENNLIENLRLTLIGSDRYIIGINNACCSNSIIRNNVVHNLCGTAANWHVNGILVFGDVSHSRGANIWIYNNMVYDINNRAPSGAVDVVGIRAQYQDSVRVEYNSVYLSETADVAPTGGSAAVWLDSSNTLPSLRNNILVNTRNDSPYVSTAIRLYTNAKISDYNDLCVGSFSNSYVGEGLLATYKSLANWQTLGYDLHSASMLPIFRDPHLHIDSTQTSSDLLDANGIPIDGILYDFDGQLRNTTAPDIGADEFIRVPTVVTEQGTAMPKMFALEQNFPNPFNPATTISFSLPSKSFVTLKIFDLIGREVATLISEELSAGSYTKQWNAENYPSGVYFYRLQSGTYSDTKKLVLLR